MYRVHMAWQAKADLIEIHNYVATHDSATKAGKLREAILKKCFTLDRLPERGHVPPEVLEFSTRQFLEIHYKPYRIVYQIIERDVFIIGILGGRRSLDVLLRERMLRYQ